MKYRIVSPKNFADGQLDLEKPLGMCCMLSGENKIVISPECLKAFCALSLASIILVVFYLWHANTFLSRVFLFFRVPTCFRRVCKIDMVVHGLWQAVQQFDTC